MGNKSVEYSRYGNYLHQHWNSVLVDGEKVNVDGYTLTACGLLLPDIVPDITDIIAGQLPRVCEFLEQHRVLSDRIARITEKYPTGFNTHYKPSMTVHVPKTLVVGDDALPFASSYAPIAAGLDDGSIELTGQEMECFDRYTEAMANDNGVAKSVVGKCNWNHPARSTQVLLNALEGAEHLSIVQLIEDEEFFEDEDTEF